MRLFNKKGQSTAEYAIVIALVIGAALAMQVYVKRGMQGGLKFVTDKLKSSETGTGQYEPYYQMSETTTQRENVYSSEETKTGEEVIRQTGEEGTEGEKTTRTYQSKQRDVNSKD